jgi:imidazolonepropionase-like amidohydrolase
MSELVLANCNAVDARGQRPEPVDVLVTAGRIRSITSAADGPRPTASAVIDCRGLTVVPGLVNMHEHLCGAHPGLEQQSIADEGQIGCAIRMAGNAMKGLRAGVTTMRLVGERDGLEFRVRDAIEAHEIEGPRLYTAGSAFDFRGGHGWVVRSLEGDTPDQYRELAAEQIGHGVDLLKVMVSESGSSPDRDTVKMSPDDFDAIRVAARKAGLRLAVHTAATEHPIIEQIIDDAVDSLEHCYSIPEQLLQRAAAKKLLLVMTPLVCRASEYFEAIELPEAMLAGLEQMSQTHWSAVTRAVASGAVLALGTDIHSHILIDGTWAVVKELELYEEAGATPTMLLEIASRNGAAWLGRQEELGLVEEGFLADLIVLGRDPLREGASAFREIRQIVAGGTVVAPRAPEPPRSSLGRRQAPIPA